MKYSKMLLFILMFGLNSIAKADLNITCKNVKELDACSDLVEETLKNMSCSIRFEETNCFFALMEDPSSDDSDARIETNTPICTVKSNNCTHTQDELFNWKEKCADAQERLMIPKKSGIHNGYWVGFWAPYSRVICKNKTN